MTLPPACRPAAPDRLALLGLMVVIAGSGAAAGPAAGASPPGTHTLSVQTGGAGTVTSVPAGLDCASTCSGRFPDQTPVTLTAQPGAHFQLLGWSGCAASGSTCSLTLTDDTQVTTRFSPVVPVAGVPYVDYTDTLSAPTRGGEKGAGGYLSIFGTGFGAASGLGTTTRVTIGGMEVANYRYLGPSQVGRRLGLQQLTVQVGGLGGAPAGTPLPVAVVVNGQSSNVDHTFTPSGGHVLFVSLQGNDATAAFDDIGHPWRSLQNLATLQGAYFALGAGDQVVLRGGTWSDTNGVDTTWMKFGAGTYARNGAPGAWIHVTAYPGPAGANAIEDVHYVTPAGASGGIQGPWSRIAGTSGEYIAVSNLHLEVAGGARRDAAPVNFQYTAGHWRVVNNEIGPWVAGSSAVLNAAGVSGHGDTMAVLGNHIHDIQGLADLQNHGIYADTTAQNWDVGYNWIHDITGGSLIQFNDNEGGAGSYRLPHGGTWPGFAGIRVHHNWLENAAKYGVNFNDQNSVKAGTYDAQVWNNVIIGTRLPPLRIHSTQPVQTMRFAFNTIWNCMTSSSGSGNALVRAEGWSAAAGVANLFYDNIFAHGPATVPGTRWFVDIGAQGASAKTYDFKRNLYFAGTASALALAQSPASIGDTRAILADPLFTAAAAGGLSTQPASPARKAATQALPEGFAVVDDLTARVWRAPGASDLGAFSAP